MKRTAKVNGKRKASMARLVGDAFTALLALTPFSVASLAVAAPPLFILLGPWLVILSCSTLNSSFVGLYVIVFSRF